MNKRRLLLGFFFIALTTIVIGQDPVLMTVNGVNVSKSEFEQIFWKNKKEDVATKEDLDEYIDLFTKFKLKVTEAEELGLDTVSSFVKELEGYKVQLQKPYLIDTKINEKLIEEAYYRINNEVRASHLLLMVKQDALPEDTLKTYNRIKQIRNEINSGKITFEEAAVKYSEDESVRVNKGDLGYFTAFRMVYPFESAAFNTAIGSVSEPFRTRFGYHLVKTVDLRKGRGTVKVAHIMLVNKKDATETEKENNRKKINEIYLKIQNGASFENMAVEFSEDRQSAAQGGELKWIKPGETFAEFDSVAFSLNENGKVAEPLLTPAGWHIIKRLDYKPVGTLESMRSELKNKIQRDSRSQISKEIFIAKLKNEYGFKENRKALKEVYKIMDSTAFIGKWKYTPNKKMKKVIAVFAGEKITLEDVAKFIERSQRPMKEDELNAMVNAKYDEYTVSRVIEYEKSQLENKHPEYKALLKEYRDGILLFEITDQKVWSKGVRDTSGLNEYYEKHKMEFMWPDRLKVKMFSSSNKEIIEEAYSLVRKGEIQNDSIVNYLNRDSQLNIKYEEGVLAIEDNEFLKGNNWNSGLNEPKVINKKFVFVVLEEKLPSAPKKIDEAKGLITAAYQNELETNWINNLKNKYPVVINEEVLYTITKKP